MYFKSAMYEDQCISREMVVYNSTYSMFSPFQDPVTLLYEKITHYLHHEDGDRTLPRNTHPLLTFYITSKMTETLTVPKKL